MTESAFPFGAPEGDAAAAPVEETSSDERNKRMMLFVGGAAGLLVLVVAAYFLFLKGGSADTTAGAVVPHRVTTAAVETKDKAAADKPALPKTFNDVVGRDPFKPLVRVPKPPKEASDSTATSTAAGATSGTTTTTGTGTGTTSTATAAPGGFGQQVTLVNVHKKNGKLHATTTVAGVEYDPRVGETFAGTFRLLAINGTAATFIQGDEQFSLSEGQQTFR